MRLKTVDPDGYSPSDTLNRLHLTIDSGTYALDYTIKLRDKNEALLEKYVLSERDRINILRNLTLEEYDGWEYSDNADFPEDIVHFFHHTISLFRRGVEDAPKESIDLYIKLTWTKPDNFLVIISFHESNTSD